MFLVYIEFKLRNIDYTMFEMYTYCCENARTANHGIGLCRDSGREENRS